MRQRGLLVCTAVVLLAHAALLGVLRGHGLTLSVASDNAATRESNRLVLLDRAQVASLTLARTESPLPQASAAQALAEPQAASALAKERAASESAPATPPASVRPTTVVYRSPAQLDQPIRARSAPDMSVLSGLPWSGLPIRLRLLIDSSGAVVDTQVLQSGEDEQVLARVRQMFLATGFTPGMEHGQPVPSYKDIEITVGPPP